jgi:methionyl-tRNA synthetase
VRTLDHNIQTEEPFKVIKVDRIKGEVLIIDLVTRLYVVAKILSIFMPQTSAKILECIAENKMPEKPLFARLP